MLNGLTGASDKGPTSFIVTVFFGVFHFTLNSVHQNNIPSFFLLSAESRDPSCFHPLKADNEMYALGQASD